MSRGNRGDKATKQRTITTQWVTVIT